MSENGIKLKSKNDKIKSIIKKRLETSSIIVFLHLFQNELKIVKYFWVVCFLLSSSWCSWFIVRSISDYMNYNVVTKTIIKHKTGLRFPVIGICNLNPFLTDHSRYFLKTAFKTETPDQKHYFKAIRYANYFNGTVSKSRFDRRKMGQNLSEFILACSFAYFNCDLEQDFEYYYDSKYGNCYRYNSGRNMKGEPIAQKKVYTSGVYSAFDIEFFIGSALTNSFPFAIENGIVIFISNETIDSNYNEGIKLLTGTSTRIILSSFTVKRQPKPYSECTNDLTSIDSYHSDTFKQTIRLLNKNSQYHYNNCFLTCYQKYLAQNCQCQTTSYGLFYNDSMKRCVIGENDTIDHDDDNCDTQFWKEFIRNLDYILKCDCPVECETNGYNYKKSQSEFPSKKYADYLLEKNDLVKQKLGNSSQQDMKKNVAKLKIFFDEMVQTAISEDPKTQLADLISNVGGTMGLFLGISFLSLIELVEILIKILLLIEKN